MSAGSFFLLLGLPPFILAAIIRPTMKGDWSTRFVLMLALGWSAFMTLFANISGHHNVAQALVSYGIMFALGFAVALVGSLAGAGVAGIGSRILRR